MTRQWFFLFFGGGQIEVCFLLPPEKNDTLPYDDFFFFFFYIFGYVNILHSIRFCNQNQPALVPSVTHICHCRVNQSHVSKVLPDRVKNTSKAHSRTVNICVWCQQFFFFLLFFFLQCHQSQEGCGCRWQQCWLPSPCSLPRRMVSPVTCWLNSLQSAVMSLPCKNGHTSQGARVSEGKIVLFYARLCGLMERLWDWTVGKALHSLALHHV